MGFGAVVETLSGKAARNYQPIYHPLLYHPIALQHVRVIAYKADPKYPSSLRRLYLYLLARGIYIYKKLQRFVVPYVLRLFRKWRGCVRANKFELSLRLIDSRGGHTMHTRVHEVNLSPPSFLLSLSFSLDFKRSRGRIAKYVAWIEKREEETRVVTAAEETSIHHTLEKGRKSIDLGFRDDVEKPRTTRWIRFVREARALLSLRATGRGRERERGEFSKLHK